MDSYTACGLSSVGQAMFTHPLSGDLYLAICDKDSNHMSYMRRRRKKKLNNYCWSKGNPWKFVSSDKGGKHWRPVALK